MKYSRLCELYEEITSTPKRLEKISFLSKFFRSLHESDKDVLYLLLGEISPDYDREKTGISNQIVIKAISKASGVPAEHVVSEWKSLGDLGKVSEKLMSKKKQSMLSNSVSLTV